VRAVAGQTADTSGEALRAPVACRVCENGELKFSVSTASGAVIVECPECMTGYTAPDDLTGSDLLRLEVRGSRVASRIEVEGAGWAALLAT
jgi:hypothetical protein